MLLYRNKKTQIKSTIKQYSHTANAICKISIHTVLIQANAICKTSTHTVLIQQIVQIK